MIVSNGGNKKVIVTIIGVILQKKFLGFSALLSNKSYCYGISSLSRRQMILQNKVSCYLIT